MRFIVPAILLLVALIYLLPLLGVLGAGRLSATYGISVAEPNLEILIRHRAVLFGMLAAFLGACAFKPAWQWAGIVAGLASVVSFLVLAYSVDSYNGAIARVVRVDVVALVLLLAGAALLALRAGEA